MRCVQCMEQMRTDPLSLVLLGYCIETECPNYRLIQFVGDIK